MDRAITHAKDELSDSVNKKAVIIITDGYPNSTTSTDRAASNAKSSGISIATIGVQGADKGYLAKIASDENLCFMVDNISKLSETFGKAVENLLRK